jgi:hypothetical protein
LPNQHRSCYKNIIGKEKYFSHSLALELTATRRVFTFQMIKTVSVEATLAPGGGSSALSR